MRADIVAVVLVGVLSSCLPATGQQEFNVRFASSRSIKRVKGVDSTQENSQAQDNAIVQPEATNSGLCGSGYTLLWHDDFSSSKSLDGWNYMLGNGCEYGICGWGNGELEWYTNSSKNVDVKNGNLRIIARKASDADRQKCCNGPCQKDQCLYTSGRIRTYNKFAVRPTYNKGSRKVRIDARIKMPMGKGLWPSMVMYPEDSPATCASCGFYGDWASSGAITVAQRLNKDKNYTGGILFGGPPPNVVASTFSQKIPKDREGYHTYSLEWTPTYMKWKLDGKSVYKAKSSSGKTKPGWYTDAQTTNKNAPFDKPFYLLLNLAVGGDQTGASANQVKKTLSSPKKMEVEYIRVCAK